MANLWLLAGVALIALGAALWVLLLYERAVEIVARAWSDLWKA